MTMQNVLHPRDDVYRLYVSIKGKEISGVEDSVDTSIQRLGDFIEKCRGKLITATRNNTDNRTKISRKQKLQKNNSMDILSDKEMIYHTRKLRTLLRKGNLKR